MANNSTLSLDKRLTTIGVTVSIGGSPVLGATDFGDLGASPATVDATTLMDPVRVNVLGLQEYETWQVNYLCNAQDTNDDYIRLKALETAAAAVPVTVDMGKNGVFSNTGTVSTWLTGAAVGELQKAAVAVALAGAWTHTPYSGQ